MSFVWKLAFCSLALCTASICSVGTAEDAVAEATTIDVFGTPMEVPAEFESTEPASRIVQHEFAVKHGEGDDAPTARLTMMAAGGGVQANLDRWKGQFSGAAKKVGEAETFDAGKFKVHVLEVSGQYAETMGGGPFSGGKTVVRDDYAMLGAIMVDGDGRSYFVKLIGPSTAVTPNKDAFMAMLKSVGK